MTFFQKSAKGGLKAVGNVMSSSGGWIGNGNMIVRLSEQDTAVVFLSPTSPDVGDTIVTTVSDSGGITGWVPTWQWYADDVAISGATSSSYTVQSSDEAKKIHVTVSYTNDESTARNLTSAKTAAIPESDSTPPTLVSATTDGTTLTLVFSEDVQNSTGVTATADAVSKALSAPSVVGDTITYTVAQIDYDETVLVSYTPGNITDLNSNALVAFTNSAVTNNSTFVELEAGNLVTSPHNLTNGDWLAPDNVTITVDQSTSPNGDLTADLITENTAATRHSVTNYWGAVAAAGPMEMSVFGKIASGSRYVQIRPYGVGTNDAWANFDLVNGVVVPGGTGGTMFTSASIETVGDFYRCVLLANYTAAPTGMNILLSNSTAERPSYTGDGTSGIYLWGIQALDGL